MTHLQKLFIYNLRCYRTRANISQLAFSEMIGITPNYLNAVENGKNFPSPDVLQRMADAIGIMPYELFLESPSSPTVNEETNQVLSRLKHDICALFNNISV